MANQITRREVESWLVGNGFVRSTKASGHIYFTGRNGLKLTLAGHGPQDLTKKIAGALRRELRRAGFDVPW